MGSLKKVLLSILALVFLSLNFGCDRDESSIVSDVGNSILSQIDGEDIFRAVYFYEGSILDMIPSMDASYYNKIMEDLSEEEMLSFVEFKDDIIKNINNNEPGFFEYFEKTMTSGNQVIIKEAMDRSLFEYERALFSNEEYASIFNEFPAVSFEYEKFLDSEGGFNRTAFLMEVEEFLLQKGVSLTSRYGNQGACILWGLVVVAYYAAAIAGVIGVIGGFYLAVAGGQYVSFAYPNDGTDRDDKGNYLEINDEDDLRVEMFIDDIATNMNRNGL